MKVKILVNDRERQEFNRCKVEVINLRKKLNKVRNILVQCIDTIDNGVPTSDSSRSSNSGGSAKRSIWQKPNKLKNIAQNRKLKSKIEKNNSPDQYIQRQNGHSTKLWQANRRMTDCTLTDISSIQHIQMNSSCSSSSHDENLLYLTANEADMTGTNEAVGQTLVEDIEMVDGTKSDNQSSGTSTSTDPGLHFLFGTPSSAATDMNSNSTSSRYISDFLMKLRAHQRPIQSRIIDCGQESTPQTSDCKYLDS